MPTVIVDTSPLQYLYQLGLLYLLPDIPVGTHQAVVVIDEVLAEENGDQRREPLDWTAYPVGLISDDFTFRREDLYDDR